jgi:hypothetical protein
MTGRAGVREADNIVLLLPAKRNRYRQYSQTTLGNAFQKVISHEMSAYKASIVYGVPATTLIDRVKGKVCINSSYTQSTKKSGKKI